MKPLVWGATLVLLLAPSAASGQRPEEATAAFRAGRYEEVIALLERLVPGQSDAPALRLARAYRTVGKFQEAETTLRLHLEASSASASLRNELGEILYETGRIAEAEAAFVQATGEGAGSLPARLNLAILQLRRGQRDAAMKAFDQFIDVYNTSRGSLGAADLTAVGTAVRYLGQRNPQLFRDALRAYDEAAAADPGDLEPQVRLGEMFLEKYNRADAHKTFQAVLAINPRHPRALLGEARRRQLDGESGAFDLVTQALDVNSNFVDGRVFLAELHLGLEEYDAAVRELERGLGVNPSSLDALAVLATARYLRGHTSEFEIVRQKVLTLNPQFAELYNRLAELSARNRLYHQAAAFAREATQLDSTSWRGYGLLGMNQLRIGAVDSGRVNLERAFQGDPYHVWIKNTLDLLDTLVTYPETATGRFRFVIAAKESEVLTVYLGPLAEEAHDRLSARYGIQLEGPIRVEIYPHHADFSVRTVGLTGLGALGVSFGPVIAMDSPSARPAGEFHWGSTFWHELAHSFHMELSRYRVPRWLTEGLAVYEERQARAGWGNDVTPDFLLAYKQDRLLPASQLNNGFVRPAYPQQVGHSYYEASLVCELIVRDFGFQALIDMLSAYGRGLSTSEVVSQVLALSLRQFDARFDTYLRERFAGPLAALKPPRAGGGERPSRPGSDDYLEQMATGGALFDAGRLDEAEPYLQRAKALFPDYVGPGSPHHRLARIYRARSDLRRAAEELTTLTTVQEANLDANLELADVLAEMGDTAGAAAALGRAVFMHPLGLSNHQRLAAMFEAQGDHQGAIRERRAVVALEPVDRAAAIYQLARAYLAAGDRRNARRQVLRALESAPNFEAAQALLLELHEPGPGRRP